MAILIAMVAGSHASPALAGRPSCPVLDCNAPAARGGVVDCFGVCTYDPANDTISCDLDQGGSGAGTASVASDVFSAFSAYCNPSWDFAAWGFDDTGGAFFCTFTDNPADPVKTVELLGTPSQDQLCLHGGNWTLHDVTAGAPVAGYAYGYASGHLVEGSFSTSTLYTDYLYTGDGADEAYGLAGNLDIFVLGPGADTASGEEGVDRMSGQGDNDTLHGGLGADLECGGTGDDVLNGNEDNDILAGGGQTGDTKYGGLGADECDAAGTNVSCATVPITSTFTCPL